MLYSSLVYAGPGALFGVAVLLLGTPLIWLQHRREPAAANKHNRLQSSLTTGDPHEDAFDLRRHLLGTLAAVLVAG